MSEIKRIEGLLEKLTPLYLHSMMPTASKAVCSHLNRMDKAFWKPAQNQEVAISLSNTQGTNNAEYETIVRVRSVSFEPFSNALFF